MLSDEAFAELRAEFNEALPDIIAGKPDRTDLMHSIERAKQRLPRLSHIVSAAAHATGISAGAITGQGTNARLAKARTLVACLLRELRPDVSQQQIAGVLNKDPSTVRNALQRSEDLKMHDNDFVHWYAGARRRLGYA